VRALGVSLLVIAAGLGPAPVAGHDEGDRWGRNVESTTRKTPEIEDIPPRGLAWNFKLVGHNPLLDSDQGSSNFDPYINPPSAFRGARMGTSRPPAIACMWVLSSATSRP